MKTTIPLLTLTAALLTGCVATVPVKGIVADKAIERAKTKAPEGEECAPILSWYDDQFAINGNRRSRAVHTGFDMAAKTGTTVIAAAPGVVLFSVLSPNNGNDVTIYHGIDIYGNHVMSASIHLSSRSVKKGDLIKRGQVIGLSGDTGNNVGNEGAHLHLNVMLHPDAAYKVGDSLKGFASVSPNLFLYPILANGKVTVADRFPKWDSQTDYGDSNWTVDKKFTGFTFPISCANTQ